MKLSDCLKDISGKPEYHKKIHNIVMEIIGKNVSSDTVWDWLKGNFVPKGINLIRLMVILNELLGYEVSEWLDLPPEIKMIGECLVFGIISEEEMKKEIFEGFSRVHIMRLLLGRGGTTLQKRKLIEERINPKIPDLIREKKVWRQRLEREDFNSSAEKKSLRSKDVPEFSSLKKIEKERVISLLSHFIVVGMPLAGFLLSENFTPEDRKKLRDLTGGDGVFKFKNLLSRLCSEQAKREL